MSNPYLASSSPDTGRRKYSKLFYKTGIDSNPVIKVRDETLYKEARYILSLTSMTKTQNIPKIKEVIPILATRKGKKGMRIRREYNKFLPTLYIVPRKSKSFLDPGFTYHVSIERVEKVIERDVLVTQKSALTRRPKRERRRYKVDDNERLYYDIGKVDYDPNKVCRV